MTGMGGGIGEITGKVRRASETGQAGLVPSKTQAGGRERWSSLQGTWGAPSEGEAAL